LSEFYPQGGGENQLAWIWNEITSLSPYVLLLLQESHKDLDDEYDIEAELERELEQETQLQTPRTADVRIPIQLQLQVSCKNDSMITM